MIYFAAHTFKCVCHCKRAMFRVLGMYNFALNFKIVQTLKYSNTRLSLFVMQRDDPVADDNTQ